MKPPNVRTKTVSWSARIVVFLLVLLGCSGISYIWWIDGIRPVNTSDNTVTNFVIKNGEPVNSIASRLAAESLIRSRTIFFLNLKLLRLDSKIQAGNFRLKRTMNATEIAQALTQGTVDTWITTLEGWRVEEIAQVLSKELGIPEREFIAVAQEGYMFPDTYLLPKEATAGAVVNVFMKNFNKRVTPEMIADAQKNNLSLEEVVILASLVEREGRSDTDRPMIAGILLKRLRTKGWTLDIDATLQYALGYQQQEKTWWKKVLTNQDKTVDSPYNTYKNAGLPPGPISNPGLASILAVIYPQDSDYWFYLHDPTGAIHYASSLAEHERNIATYLR